MSATAQYLPVHPFTGPPPVGIVNGRPVWPILGASEGDNSNDADVDDDSGADANDEDQDGANGDD